jgi:hypothetical protein
MGHALNYKGKFMSSSPVVCLSCHSPYNYAEIIEPIKYFEFRIDTRRADGKERQEAHSG